MLDAAAVRRWARQTVAALAKDRDAIDRINVYPVADGDTGTNLLHTMRSAVRELDRSRTDDLRGVTAALARGAVSGARGNSGMLLSQVLRGIAEEIHQRSEADGKVLLAALARAECLARQAVTEPVEGTLLTVLRVALDAARNCGSPQADVVACEAANASVRALSDTTGQLPALAEAGVVDAGGCGLVILLDVLQSVLGDRARIAEEPPAAGVSADQHHESEYAYEVMYLVSEADASGVAMLRDRLTEVGDCVSVVGDGEDSSAVHVHCDDIGAAIEAGIETGRVRHIKVVRFSDQRAADQAILACAHGEALAELFRAEGVAVLEVGNRPPDVADVVAALGATEAAHVVVLPNDLATTKIAEDAARRAVRAGQDVVVVPTASPVQGLAALAVHDPGRRRSEDAVAMAEAAAATRRGELFVAEHEALTWAGRCAPGDVLGLVDGEVVLIGRDVLVAAGNLADRMLVAGGELVTALLSENAPEELPEELARHLRHTHPEVELSCYFGGELGSLLLFGVE